MIIPKKKVNGLPHLEIKDFDKMQQLKLYSEICMSGYPSGEQSLTVDKEYGIRFSPIIQFGHITGFMPIDDIRVPWGIQTDIIGAGGSSGSALTDSSDGKVIGIAQRVLQCGINGIYTEFSNKNDCGEVTRRRMVTGKANIGLVYGITAYSFFGLPDIVKMCHEKGMSLTSFNRKYTALHPLGSKVSS